MRHGTSIPGTAEKKEPYKIHFGGRPQRIAFGSMRLSRLSRLRIRHQDRRKCVDINASSDDRQALHRIGVSADAGVTCLSAAQRIQDPGDWQQRQTEVRDARLLYVTRADKASGDRIGPNNNVEKARCGRLTGPFRADAVWAWWRYRQSDDGEEAIDQAPRRPP
jgi:hypothetical protein